MTRPRLTIRPWGSVRAALVATVSFVLALAVAGCGPVVSDPPSVAPTTTPLPTPVTTSYVLETTAWYAGLIIHVDAASSVLDEGGGAVTVDLRLENPATELATLNVAVLLAAGGRAVEPIRGTVLPDVPPGTSVGTTLRFDVDGTFDIPNAALRIGRTAEHIVIIPLVPGSQAASTLEPRSLALTGSATAGSLTVTLGGGEIRADLPDWGLELPRAVMALSVTYTARYRGDFRGGFAFTGANLGLRLPDGTLVGARTDGHSQSIAVLEPGAALPNLFARFEVPAPATGMYALIVRDGSARSAIPFTIDAADPPG